MLPLLRSNSQMILVLKLEAYFKKDMKIFSYLNLSLLSPIIKYFDSSLAIFSVNISYLLFGFINTLL